MLDNFIDITNYCEQLGYEFEMIMSKKGVTCDLYKDGKLLKIGNKVFTNCIEAQKFCYTALYENLTLKKH